MRLQLPKVRRMGCHTDDCQALRHGIFYHDRRGSRICRESLLRLLRIQSRLYCVALKFWVGRLQHRGGFTYIQVEVVANRCQLQHRC